MIAEQSLGKIGEEKPLATSVHFVGFCSVGWYKYEEDSIIARRVS